MIVQLNEWKKKKGDEIPSSESDEGIKIERTPRPVLLPHQIVVRLGDDEMKTLDEAAAEDGESISEIVRQLIRRGDYYPAAPIREAAREINKAGVNLNQVAKALNSGTAADETMKKNIGHTFYELRVALNGLWQCLGKVV